MNTQPMIIAQLETFNTIRYLNVATATILVYDYCLTLGQEISFIWADRWSVMHILYMFTRYMPFFDTAINLHQLFVLGPKRHHCIVSVTVDAYLFVVGIGITEMILLVRTWIVWDRSRGVAICMFTLYAGIWSGLVISTWHWVQSLDSYSSPHVMGCNIKYQQKFLLIDWLLFMMFEIVMLVFILVKTFQSYARTYRVVPLFRVIYGDGILFYVYVVAISALNVGTVVGLPTKGIMLTPFGRTMHSVLTVRLVLKLRQVLHKTNIRQENHHFLSTNTLSMHNTALMSTVYTPNRTVY